MNCVEVSGNLEAMFDETLDAVSRASINQHLSVCAKCKTDWHDLQQLRRLLRESMVIAPSEMLDERTLKAFDNKWPASAAEPVNERSWWRKKITIPVPAFAMTLVLLAGIFWSFSAWNRDTEKSVKRVTPLNLTEAHGEDKASREAVDLSRFDHGERAVIYVEKGTSSRAIER
jgi:hypothetical protein